MDYFSKGKNGGGSLLILGTQPALRKAFMVAGKTPEKVNLSYGEVELDSNNILRFVPDKNGMKVKPKPLVDSLKKAPISKSNPGFWSKRKVSNVILGAAEPAGAELTGNSDLVEESIHYTEEGVSSEIYDRFKVFVNRDYTNSSGTRNAEYYAQTLKQLNEWLAALQAELKSKGDATLKAGYTKMAKVMLAFKKQVQEEQAAGRTQNINEGSSLSTFENVFKRTLKEYYSLEDPYQKSVLKAKLKRILLELEQQINNGTNAKEAIALKKRLQESLKAAKSPKNTAVQQEIQTLIAELGKLLDAYNQEEIA